MKFYICLRLECLGILFSVKDLVFVYFIKLFFVFCFLLFGNGIVCIKFINEIGFNRICVFRNI